MAHGLAFVLRAGQWLVAHFVAGRALSIAALSVAEVQFTVSQFLAFGLTAEGFYAAHFARLKTTETALGHDFFALTEGDRRINLGKR